METQVQHHSIRVRYAAGPARHDNAVVGIGVFPTAEQRDSAIAALRDVANRPASAWVFEPYDQDRNGCDLWAERGRVWAAIAEMPDGGLDDDPDAVLNLFRDVTGEGHGWYHIIHDGDWVDARELYTYSPDDVVTAADGASTTVGALAALAFNSIDLEHGQTEALDALRLHMVAHHSLLNATDLTDETVTALHAYEHRGIDSHPEDNTDWTLSQCLAKFVDDGDVHDSDEAASFNAHIERTNNPGQAQTKPAPPKIYEEVSRYTVSVLPPADPWRRHYLIEVERRGDGKWTVNHSGFWTNRHGEWSVPYSGDHVPAHLFELDEALALARKLAPTVECNERTALDVLGLPKEGRR